MRARSVGLTDLVGLDVVAARQVDDLPAHADRAAIFLARRKHEQEQHEAHASPTVTRFDWPACRCYPFWHDGDPSSHRWKLRSATAAPQLLGRRAHGAVSARVLVDH